MISMSPKLPSPTLRRLILVAATSLLLAACGGGGGSPGSSGSGTGTSTGTSPGTTPVAAAPTLTLALVDATGTAKSSITTSSPLTAMATVKDATGKPIANTVVAFAVGPDLTVISPAAGTALTNASGVASVTLAIKSLAVAQTQSGAADSVSASVTVGDQAVLAKTSYSIGTSAISLQLVAPSPSTINLNAYDTTPIKVDVLTDGKVYLAQPVTVNFTSACAGLRADLPTTATTINGRAQVVYRDKGCSATDTVTASVPGATSVTATLVIAPPVAASIGFVSGIPGDKAIVIKGAGGNGRTETAVLTFRVLDTFGQPLANQLVSFALNPMLDAAGQPVANTLVTLQALSATTGADGQVIVAVNSGNTPTTFRVIASLALGQSTISDTITVTTGQPVQTAFSLSTESYNIEGWQRDNEKTKITILMADSAGNPVADGTPVVFQTDSGAIGSAAIGGCVSTNGGCTVDFRSQAPRYDATNTLGKRAGLATISVSSTSASVNLTGKIAVFLSGSTASNVFLEPSAVPLSVINRTRLSTSGCGNYSLRLEINDMNFNPMPAGTSVATTNADKVAIGTIIPASVPSIAPRADPANPLVLAPRQGTVHYIPVKPDTATCNITGTPDRGTGSFDVVITSPSGIATIYGFTVNYPAL